MATWAEAGIEHQAFDSFLAKGNQPIASAHATFGEYPTAERHRAEQH